MRRCLRKRGGLRSTSLWKPVSQFSQSFTVSSGLHFLEMEGCWVKLGMMADKKRVGWSVQGTIWNALAAYAPRPTTCCTDDRTDHLNNSYLVWYMYISVWNRHSCSTAATSRYMKAGRVTPKEVKGEDMQARWLALTTKAGE